MKRLTNAPSYPTWAVRLASVALIMLLAVMGLAPHAVAQEGDNTRNEVAGTIEGKGTEEERDDAQQKITDALEDLANGGEANGQNLEVLNGLGGAQNSLELGELERLLSDFNQGNLTAILSNPEIMNRIREASPTGATFIEQTLAPIISEFTGGGSNGLVGAIQFILGGATGGQYTLQGNYTYSDLLPSVIYSRKQNEDGVVNSMQIPLSELTKYPAGDADTYGQMASPSENSATTGVGNALGAYIAGLYDYDWIVSIDNEGNSYSAVGDTFKDGASVAGIGLTMGVFGAKIYDAAVGVIGWLSDAFTAINLPTLLGLTDTASDDNWLTSTTRNVLDSMGLTQASVKAIQFVIAVVVGGLFVMFLMFAMRAPTKGSYRDSRVKSFAMRVVMVVIAIPFIAVFTGVVNNMTEGIVKDSYGEAAKINEGYVVDTLTWAAVTNLNLADAGYSAPGALTSPDAYQPSTAAVGNLMRAVDSRGLATGLLPESETNRSATELLEAMTSGQTADVNSYLAAISGGADYAFNGGLQSAATQIAAASVPRRGATISSANHLKMVDDGAATMIAPYFLTDRATDDKLDGDVRSGSTDTGETTDGETPDPAEGATDSTAHSKNTFFGSNNLFGKDYECNTGAMSCAAVKWNTPSTYIYGADTPSLNSRSYRNFTGEIHDQNVQSNDPGTGEPSEDGIMEANAVSIAMMNRYAGISNINGVPSLSTQSVAFLLQSTYDNGTLRYNGINTAAEGASGAKNNGAHGTVFLRYTMPNTGYGDLYGKISSLAVLWLTSGIIAVVALFALFRAPLLIAFLNMFRGIFGAMTGKVSGVLVYCTYYLALRTAFLFVASAITLGANVASWLVDLLPEGMGTDASASVAMGNADVPAEESKGFFGTIFSGVGNFISNFNPMNIAAGAANTLSGNILGNAFTGVITSFMTVVMSLMICAILCWPIFTVPSHKGQVRKLSLVSTVVLLPFLVADMAGEWIDKLARKVGEKPMTAVNGFGGKLKALDPKENVKDGVKRAAHVGRDLAAVGAAMATGGASAAGTQLAKKAATAGLKDKVMGRLKGGLRLRKKDGAEGVDAVEGSEKDMEAKELQGGVNGGQGADNATVEGRERDGADSAKDSAAVAGNVEGNLNGNVEGNLNGNVEGDIITSGDVTTRTGTDAAESVNPATILENRTTEDPAEVTIKATSDAAELPATHDDNAAGTAAAAAAGAAAGASLGNAQMGKAEIQEASITNATITNGQGLGTDKSEVDRERDDAPQEPDPGRRFGRTRTVGKTLGLAAYGAFDQGKALEKHMEALANRHTGTTAEDRSLPFEKERKSSLSSDELSKLKGENWQAMDSRVLDKLSSQQERVIGALKAAGERSAATFHENSRIHEEIRRLSRNDADRTSKD